MIPNIANILKRVAFIFDTQININGKENAQKTQIGQDPLRFNNSTSKSTMGNGTYCYKRF